MMNGYGMAGGWLGMGLWWIFPVAILGAVVWLIVRGMEPRSQQESALDILAKRFARGEIDDEEYARKRRDLAR